MNPTSCRCISFVPSLKQLLWSERASLSIDFPSGVADSLPRCARAAIAAIGDIRGADVSVDYGPTGIRADLLRLKGIVNIAESPDRPAVIHGVQHVFHAPAWLERWPSNDRRSRMVFITRRIPRRWVKVLLDAVDAEVAGVSAQG